MSSPLEPFLEIKLIPEFAFDESYIHQKLIEKYGSKYDLKQFVLFRRSIDARQNQVYYILKFALKSAIPQSKYSRKETPAFIQSRPRVLIVGAGPAGYFAALELIAQGFTPIVIERGKDVRERRRDLKAIQQLSIVHPDSNYCFGEGGAGTYSDGKLYTRSTKRGDVGHILRTFYDHGAPNDILIDSNPHIGTNKLPKIIEALRSTIIHNGGEIHFDCKLLDVDRKNDKILAAHFSNGVTMYDLPIVLATGHSARDIFEMMLRHQILIESKSFALGVRVEHPQSIIDRIQYHCDLRSPYLPAASYSLVSQEKDKGVFSFCMCPGGMIVPSATAPGEIVVNGMSPSRRDSYFANSGIVVTVDINDVKDLFGDSPLSLLNFQRSVEQKMFQMGNGTQSAPAQRLQDFVNQRDSQNLPPCSYIPGIFPSRLDAALPHFISSRLRTGFISFGKKMSGYLTNDAVILGVESRTSSPVRIPRHNHTLQHTEITNLYPCGEGAGYAGGIISAAIDGVRVAKAIAEHQ